MTHANMTTTEAAAYLGKSASWLNQSRCRGDGPPFFRLGSSVRYSAPEIDKWVQSQRATRTHANDNAARRVAA